MRRQGGGTLFSFSLASALRHLILFSFLISFFLFLSFSSLHSFLHPPHSLTLVSHRLSVHALDRKLCFFFLLGATFAVSLRFHTIHPLIFQTHHFLSILVDVGVAVRVAALHAAVCCCPRSLAVATVSRFLCCPIFCASVSSCHADANDNAAAARPPDHPHIS